MKKLLTSNYSFIVILLLSVCLQTSNLLADTPVIKIVPLKASDLVYDTFSQRIYASVDSTDTNHGNSIAIINPVTGIVEASVFVFQIGRNRFRPKRV